MDAGTAFTLGSAAPGILLDFAYELREVGGQ